MKGNTPVVNSEGTSRGRRLLGKISGALEPLGRIPRKFRFVAGGVIVLAAAGLLYYNLAYLPSQASEEPQMQTATIRQGELVISASGSGTLVARQEVNLAFQTAGTVIEVLVKVGDEVQKGDLLARVEDEDARTQLAQARRALQELTSDSAVATALGDIATAEATLDKAKGHLAYLISPNVYHWENELASRQEALADAQANLADKPEDETLKEAVTTAEQAVEYAAEEPGRCAVQLRAHLHSRTISR